MKYFVTPNYLVAINPKVGSSTLARAIIKDFYPAIESRIQNASYPTDKNPDNTMWHGFCPSTELVDKTVILLVRDVVERFKSAMAQLGLTDVDTALTALENRTKIHTPKKEVVLYTNPHFQFQNILISGTTKLYLFPAHLDNAATTIGLSLPLLVVNEASQEKPTLTQEQESRVLAYYADDVVLYNSVTTPGQEYVPPITIVEPTPYAISKLTLRRRMRAAGFESAFDALLDSSPQAKADWNDAQLIMTNDPLVLTMLPVIQSTLSLSDAAIQSLMSPE